MSDSRPLGETNYSLYTRSGTLDHRSPRFQFDVTLPITCRANNSMSHGSVSELMSLFGLPFGPSASILQFD